MAEKSLKQLYEDLRRSAGFAVVAGGLDPQTLPPADEQARERALALVREALAAQVETTFGDSAAQHFARLSAMETRLGNHLLSIEDALGVSLRQIAQTETRLNELATRIEGLGETLGLAIAEAESAAGVSSPPDAAALQAAVAPLHQEMATLRRHIIAIETVVHNQAFEAKSASARNATALPPSLRSLGPQEEARASGDSPGPWIAGIVAALLGGILMGLYGATAASAITRFLQNIIG